MPSKPVRIISIDPGYDRVGIAILDVLGQKSEYVHSECFTTSKKETLSTRLTHLGERMFEVCKKYKPEEAALEKLFFANNRTTGVAVAQAVGVITYIVTTKNIPLYEYTPLEVKMAITSYGRAEKQDVHNLLEKLIELPKKKRIDDELDALAIGITHAAYRQGAEKKPV
jgi:crossover junction endodeoxyribonuclease RuvC